MKEMGRSMSLHMVLLVMHDIFSKIELSKRYATEYDIEREK
jgi:hypothetical protein